MSDLAKAVALANPMKDLATREDVSNLSVNVNKCTDEVRNVNTSLPGRLKSALDAVSSAPVKLDTDCVDQIVNRVQAAGSNTSNGVVKLSEAVHRVHKDVSSLKGDLQSERSDLKDLNINLRELIAKLPVQAVPRSDSNNKQSSASSDTSQPQKTPETVNVSVSVSRVTDIPSDFVWSFLASS